MKDTIHCTVNESKNARSWVHVLQYNKIVDLKWLPNKIKNRNLCMPASLVALQRFNRDTLS